MNKSNNIQQERLTRIAAAGGKHIEPRDYCGMKDPTAGVAIANMDSEERYRAGNNGRGKYDMTPGRDNSSYHKQSGRTPEQVKHHNDKMAARREARKAAREEAGVTPEYRKEITTNVQRTE